MERAQKKLSRHLLNPPELRQKSFIVISRRKLFFSMVSLFTRKFRIRSLPMPRIRAA